MSIPFVETQLFRNTSSMQPIRVDANHLNAFQTRRPPETPGDPTETPRKLARRPRGDPRRPPRRPRGDPMLTHVVKFIRGLWTPQMLTSWKTWLLIRHPAGRTRRTGPRDIPADPIDELPAAGRPAGSAVVSDSLTQRTAVGTPGHLARGQQFLGQKYFPGLVSKPVPENKNVTFYCDACERGSGSVCVCVSEW